MEFLRGTYLGVDLGTDGDYVPAGSQGLRLVRRETCAHGHPVAQTSWGVCPRNRAHSTTLFYCEDRRCTGTQTSHAHETVCPINRGRSID